jgi:GT2 family glycosyltransferase
VSGRSSPFPLEIIVVDDASTDGSCDHLAEAVGPSPNFRLVVRRLERWSGIPFARNRGAEIATHPIYVITDANTCYPQNWDLPIRQHFHPSRLLAGTIVDEATGARGYGLTLHLPSMGVEWLPSTLPFAGYVPVAACTCTVIAKGLFHYLGGYDESLPLYGAAEPEFSVRAWLSGCEIVSVPDLLVRHHFRPMVNRIHFEKLNSPVLYENYIRFAILYLPDEVLNTTLNYYSHLCPSLLTPRINQAYFQNAWHRRSLLKQMLPRDFWWFAERFGLRPRRSYANSSLINHSIHSHAQPRIAVYTAIIGRYDTLKPACFSSADFICFTDDPSLAARGWRVIPVASSDKCSQDMKIRTARRVKLLPHECLPDYDAWVWVDGNLSLKIDPSILLRTYLHSCDLATFKYPGARDCLYEEAAACIKRGKDDKGLIQSQMTRYRSEGFPSHRGLVETSILVRRNSPVVKRFDEQWWRELEIGSRRDQLSFNYVAWKLNFQYAHLPGSRLRSPIADCSPHRINIYPTPERCTATARPRADITILLLNWKRPENLRCVLDSIGIQTVRPIIFLWNNGGPFNHRLVDWQVKSPINACCAPRWSMGAMAPTRFVCSLDDDVALADNQVLSDLVDYMDKLSPRDCLVGAFGVILHPHKSYKNSQHLGARHGSDTRVDIVKGRFLACSTETLRSVRMVLASEDDIELSSLVARGRPKYHRLPGILGNRLVNLPEHGVGLAQRPEHHSRREVARRYFFGR